MEQYSSNIFNLLSPPNIFCSFVCFVLLGGGGGGGGRGYHLPFKEHTYLVSIYSNCVCVCVMHSINSSKQ